ncbi:hypothetical protein M0R45_029860 [Rubus argutus]|uniref:Uncharacterized protein n=1 Tax=Rubus argutus TaxID=59490 RepID=A0AAW1WBJ0_RUBAR
MARPWDAVIGRASVDCVSISEVYRHGLGRKFGGWEVTNGGGRGFGERILMHLPSGYLGGWLNGLLGDLFQSWSGLAW